MNHYQRSIEQLREVASMFWPEELSRQAAKLSIVPLLLATQDQFLAILGVKVDNIEQLYQLVEIASLPANIFLKHLMILADFGGELLQRVNDNFDTLFPSGFLVYEWGHQTQRYKFQSLPIKGRLTNDKLGVSGKKLVTSRDLDALIMDVTALLLLGSTNIIDETTEVLAKCEVGNYLGRPDALREFVKQRYIWVSRITAGSQSNTLGQLAQQFVKNDLQENLDIEGATIKMNGSLPGVLHAEESANRPTTFDIVVSKDEKYVAIEISFQVTTNSVIERKSGQAKNRFQQATKSGHKIAYVLDGAGNFQRETALSTICSFSHCTVAFSRSELEVLCQFIREVLG